KGAKDADGKAITDAADISITSGKLTITSKTTGSDSQVKIETGGTDAAKLATDLGITSGDENKGKGTTGADSGSGSGFTANLQIGANTGQSFNISINDMRADALDISSTDKTAAKKVTVNGKEYDVKWNENQEVTDGTVKTGSEFALDVSSHENATAAIGVLDEAINKVSSERSKLGAYQNRLEHTINNLNTSSENLTAAESRVRDVDMAKEMMTQTKNSILSQAAQAMLAQANQQPQGVLQLLR
ncbi:flagellin, partial [Niallia sp. HCP3S3_B10]|uniref:flagellin n=1 Tax=Niallia sp. HCP3S3_B10 TaxID=3438944 RepID=UPI003F8913D5